MCAGSSLKRRSSVNGTEQYTFIKRPGEISKVKMFNLNKTYYMNFKLRDFSTSFHYRKVHSTPMQYIIHQYSTVQYNTVSTVQYSTVQYSTVKYLKPLRRTGDVDGCAKEVAHGHVHQPAVLPHQVHGAQAVYTPLTVLKSTKHQSINLSMNQ